MLLQEPIDIQLEETYCCCCVSRGGTEVMVKLPVSGYCPGQTMPVEVTCSTRGSVGIDDVKLKITKVKHEVRVKSGMSHRTGVMSRLIT